MEKTDQGMNKKDAPLMGNGFDYGVLPTMLVTGNPVFVQLWEESKCDALGYGIISNYRHFENIPFVMFRFAALEKGCLLFELLRSWGGDSDSGKGFDVSFIEQKEGTLYWVCLRPNESDLVNRTIGSENRHNYSLEIAVPAIFKEFVKSEGYYKLRETTKDKPLLIVPGGPNGPVPKLAILKENVPFLHEDTLSSGTLESALSTNPQNNVHASARSVNIPTPDEICKLRNQQLARFFPLTCARLQFNKSFTQSQKKLANANNHWQILQAACNLTCLERFPASKDSTGKLSFARVYELLCKAPEPVGNEIPLKFIFSPNQLEIQIRHDAAYLGSCINAKSFPYDDEQI